MTDAVNPHITLCLLKMKKNESWTASCPCGSRTHTADDHSGVSAVDKGERGSTQNEGKEWWSCCHNECFDGGACLNCGTDYKEHQNKIVEEATRRERKRVKKIVDTVCLEIEEMADGYHLEYCKNPHCSNWCDIKTPVEAKLRRILNLLTPPPNP